jgi:diguanylate cyclase (GGDEF)-like protein/PAS domain S-box-containing protein
MSETIRILLVEDEEIDQIAFVRSIQREGLPYEAVVVGSVQAARSALAEQKFDVVVTDYHLGPDTALDLLGELHDIPFIVTTGLGDEGIAVNAMKLGASDYLTKDMQGNYLKKLPSVVENAIRLKKAENELIQYRENLEKLVAERTEELTLINQQLRQEVKERKQAEAQVLLQATALDSAANGILITDVEGKILWVNPAFEKITSYSLDEIIGNLPEFFGRGQQGIADYSEHWASVQYGQSWRGEVSNVRKDGSEYVLEITITPVIDVEGKITHYIAICQDITEGIRVKEQLEYQATHDLLTGLPNRLLFSDRLDHALAIAKRIGQQGAILLIDMDDFKSINDAFSHEEGDEFLKRIVGRFEECLRESDTVARIGGDEFAVLLENVDQDTVGIVAQKVNQVLSEPMKMRGNTIISTASIGISVFPQDGEDFTTLFKNADLAMYQAKEEKNTYQFYSHEMVDKIKKQMELTNYLHYALQNDIFQLHFQPQVNAETGKVIGLEALLRLPHPEKEWISPGEFIPLVEKTGLITSIDEWVLRAAGKKMRELLDAGFPEIKMSVNLSNRQLMAPSLFDILKNVLEENKLNPNALELEISENSLFQNVDKTIKTLSKLNALGLKLAIDDFGTGYSSLNYLAHFPLDTLKIDLSFTQKVPASENDAAIVTGVVAIANNLGLSVIVEGVEKKEQLDFFSSLGCCFIQGFFYSPAVPFCELENLLNDGFPLPP